MPTYQYTSATRIQSRISANGSTLRLDDVTTPNNASLINDVMDWAADDAEMYVAFGYNLLTLSTNSWFIQQVTNIAVAYLCMRRLNSVPESAHGVYERSLEMLERVRLGAIQIPGAARNKGAAPAISNVRVSQRPFNRVVVERMRSRTAGAVQADGYTQNADLTEWFNYGSDWGYGYGI